jgi:hypothetical protein
MTIQKLFSAIENTLVSKFDEMENIIHKGDRGENREEILKKFLLEHLPKRYGVTKGEIVDNSGWQSHSIDIIIYDSVNCPILYAGETAILPIEGVYGIIEVKSRLSKTELYDAANKIKLFKENADRNLTYHHCNTKDKYSLPFGIIFAFDVADNSLESLLKNQIKFDKDIDLLQHNVNYIIILKHGIIHYLFIDENSGKDWKILTSQEIKEFSCIVKVKDKVEMKRIGEKGDSFGKFYIYLLGILSKMNLCIPNMDDYYNPRFPILIFDNELYEKE